MAAQGSQAEVEFSLGDLWAIVRRRFLWFLVPALLATAAAAVLALSWPALYEAASTILIEPMAIPPDLVATTVGSDTEARFSQIKFSILARDNLAEVIEKFGLYVDLEAPMEERVIRMRDGVILEDKRLDESARDKMRAPHEQPPPRRSPPPLAKPAGV